MGLKELRAEHLKKYMDLKRCLESVLTRNRNMEEKETRDDFNLARRSAVGKSKEKENLERMMLKRHRLLLQIRETIKNATASVKDVKENEASERGHGKMKEELSNKLEEFENKLNQMTKMLEDIGTFIMGNDPHINRKQTPSYFANPIRECDRIEERRYYVRKEVSANRRNNQLKAANLNRGLVMDVEGQGASKSDSTFDLTSLDEALPPVSHYSKRATGMKRTLKLQDLVMNNMKENRLLRFAATGLCSMDTTSAGGNS
ncbi:hypothetical protein AVEN_105903-1 [Araneus ventricosus]|uniref:Uncharacterized protein n=1 Tax=Araneus ventricosus TaxID=182803 RepID=A0A4Y2PBX4_ARAVE|nr:hypothetical protein AVEN_105903-1 [Araneus ventricosus]